MNIDAAINVDDIRKLARSRLPRIIYEYLEGGAEDEKTLRGNRACFDEIDLVPRVTAGHKAIAMQTDLFGETVSFPAVVGPTGMNGIFHRHADLALAQAASQAGLAFALATASNDSIEQVGAACKGVKWFQLYPWGEPPVWKRLLERARGAGFTCLVLTVDTPVPGNRERDRRNHFAHDVTIKPRTVLDGLMHPRWLLGVWLRGVPRFENLLEFVHPQANVHEIAAFTRKHRHPDLSWDDVRHIRRLWPGPFVIKGILCVEDARQALAVGADGIVISNHGGRQLDGVAPTLRMVEPIASEVGHALTVLVDGGFRRGSDIVKALALGARAVTLGRAPLYGVAAGGQAGASRVLQILVEETHRVMALLGCGSTADLCVDHVQASQTIWRQA
ncbi:alpha-hydroxy acid oxidase [Orrella sp. JC864]|uniref:alpha-hydroxy acid oxidase n=1 Tax=Orrella sp. JC864 TaxID=3120298 RepID=UPI003008C91A